MNRKFLIFAAAVMLQVLILIAMPARQAYTRATGRSVTLKVQPFDPYNSLSGYYVILGYDISRGDSFPKAPKSYDNSNVYAVIEQQPDGSWKPVSLSTEVPRNLSSGQVFIQGHANWNRINYGIEEFYIPEEKRGEIEKDLRENIEHARVEIKVDSSGRAALERLLIKDRIYE
jgi:uncharacterized membrane-anchored protein